MATKKSGVVRVGTSGNDQMKGTNEDDNLAGSAGK